MFRKPLLILPAVAALLCLVMAGVSFTRAVLLHGVQEQDWSSVRGEVSATAPKSPRGQQDILMVGGQRFVFCYGFVGEREEEERCAKAAKALQGERVQIDYVNNLILKRHVARVVHLGSNQFSEGTPLTKVASKEQDAAALLVGAFLLFGGIAVVVIKY